MPKTVEVYKSPAQKVIKFLRKGCDRLREKSAALRVELRRAQNRIRAITNSRENWERCAWAAEAELEEQKELHISGT